MFVLAGIILLGILAQWIAWRVRVPAILPLILIGLVVGPISTLWTADGQKLINPIYNHETGNGLFPGEYLFYFVSLAIGIILFEGGLTLKRKEIKDVGPTILKLITIGSLVTFLGAGLAGHLIMGLPWHISFLFASLIIVTGPTVIAPILQNVPLNRNVSTVLKWEGILIDPIGALVAVLVFEFIRSAEGDVNFTAQALIAFFQVILIGFAAGAFGAGFLYLFIKRNWIPPYLLNVFTLALVLGVFIFSDVLAHESGLLSVVVMGMILGNLDVPRLKDILDFKESLSILLISILFILLAANIDMSDLELIAHNNMSLALFAFVAFLLRPLSVFLSTPGESLTLREKLFISWVGPRGIVAAGIASLFGITLERRGVAGAEYITPLVFMIVLGTVLLNATTARFVAKILGVIQQSSSGVLFVGANGASRVLAKYLKDHQRHVVLIDNNEINVKKAQEMGLEAFIANIFTDDLSDHFDLLDMGYLIAMTSNPDLNQYAVNKFQHIFGENGAYRLITPEELRKKRKELPQQGIFSYSDDFLNISEVARDYPNIHEIPIESNANLEELLEQMNTVARSIPIFIKYPDGQFHPIPCEFDQMEIKKGFSLIYLGKELEASPLFN